MDDLDLWWGFQRERVNKEDEDWEGNSAKMVKCESPHPPMIGWSLGFIGIGI